MYFLTEYSVSKNFNKPSSSCYLAKRTEVFNFLYSLPTSTTLRYYSCVIGTNFLLQKGNQQSKTYQKFVSTDYQLLRVVLNNYPNFSAPETASRLSRWKPPPDPPFRSIPLSPLARSIPFSIHNVKSCPSGPAGWGQLSVGRRRGPLGTGRGPHLSLARSLSAARAP